MKLKICSSRSSFLRERATGRVLMGLTTSLRLAASARGVPTAVGRALVATGDVSGTKRARGEACLSLWPPGARADWRSFAKHPTGHRSLWPPGAKAATGGPASPCRARAVLRVEHGLQRTEPSAGGRSSLAAALIDNSFRLLANKLLQLAAAPCRDRTLPPLARGDVPTGSLVAT